jgi:hypothetical protein
MRTERSDLKGLLLDLGPGKVQKALEKKPKFEDFCFCFFAERLLCCLDFTTHFFEDAWVIAWLFFFRVSTIFPDLDFHPDHPSRHRPSQAAAWWYYGI